MKKRKNVRSKVSTTELVGTQLLTTIHHPPDDEDGDDVRGDDEEVIAIQSDKLLGSSSKKTTEIASATIKLVMASWLDCTELMRPSTSDTVIVINVDC